MGAVGMSEHEDDLLDLMAVAKKQLATVQTATAAMQKQSGELYDAIAQIRNMQASVANDARAGAQQGLASIRSEITESLRDEAMNSRIVIHETTRELANLSVWMRWRYVVAWGVCCFLVGCLACWFMWERDAKAAASRIDDIEKSIEKIQQVQQQHGPTVAAKKSLTQKQNSRTNRP